MYVAAQAKAHVSLSTHSPHFLTCHALQLAPFFIGRLSGKERTALPPWFYQHR
jgi:hypothetical protein